ncbi:MAG: YggT family protein [Bacilli bacterium]|nr:YggT family protein [Bacilli bacterium]
MVYIIYALYWLMLAYEGFMFVSIIMSWIPPLYGTKVFNFFRKGTDFYLKPFRGWLTIGFLDLTPMIGLFIYSFGINCIFYYLQLLTTLY